jgi:hypothetical protein
LDVVFYEPIPTDYNEELRVEDGVAYLIDRFTNTVYAYDLEALALKWKCENPFGGPIYEDMIVLNPTITPSSVLAWMEESNREEQIAEIDKETGAVTAIYSLDFPYTLYSAWDRYFIDNSLYVSSPYGLAKLDFTLRTAIDGQAGHYLLPVEFLSSNDFTTLVWNSVSMSKYGNSLILGTYNVNHDYPDYGFVGRYDIPSGTRLWTLDNVIHYDPALIYQDTMYFHAYDTTQPSTIGFYMVDCRDGRVLNRHINICGGAAASADGDYIYKATGAWLINGHINPEWKGVDSLYCFSSLTGKSSGHRRPKIHAKAQLHRHITEYSMYLLKKT